MDPNCLTQTIEKPALMQIVQHLQKRSVLKLCQPFKDIQKQLGHHQGSLSLCLLCNWHTNCIVKNTYMEYWKVCTYFYISVAGRILQYYMLLGNHRLISSLVAASALEKNVEQVDLGQILQNGPSLLKQWSLLCSLFQIRQVSYALSVKIQRFQVCIFNLQT